MSEKTCCFIGQANLPTSKINYIMKRLNEEVEGLIKKGVTIFVSSGMRGFDEIAALLIAVKKEMGYDIQLKLVLPHADQEQLWSVAEKERYHYLIESGNEVKYISEVYGNNYTKKRNCYMID